MPDIDTAVQQQLDELGERIDDVRRIIVSALGGHNSNPQPAASHNSGETATLLVLDEQTKELRRLRQDLANLPEQFAVSLENHFEVGEDLDDEEPKRGNTKARTKAGNAKRGNAAADADDEPVRRRGYYDSKD